MLIGQLQTVHKQQQKCKNKITNISTKTTRATLKQREFPIWQAKSRVNTASMFGGLAVMGMRTRVKMTNQK